ncbi:putative sporulation protein (polysaccharide deacetylase family) [Aneurinibacillus soli]|uniref:Peptidoglycan-N-acetylmuramic acid deacetylase PdaA n=1 Tax=Aneurinibacillus soli TaxID=1500254 RepID=A0A0U4WGA4_9BACL|nr:polysaccharide deacetylase family protein [Aneurinibacillus soli]PYE63348.1 putative sporulation protein (polysaccharide deacetylase family) [Aneurinibacillus soli]BAU27721.1 Peptidoglycan-N-acetylmuramic acid deacetylase PdaA precursor [Aneurinibacillus soli]
MKKWMVVVGGSFLLYGMVMYSPVDTFIASRKLDQAALQTQVADWEARLVQIESQKGIAPQNARLDSIWKAIPGYNGLAVDREATLARMAKAGQWDENQIVYREVAPTVQLDQLAPAPIYRGNPQKPVVGLMINVAWGNEYLPAILDTLARHKVKATFFLDGSWTKKYPDEAKKIVAAGHEIGSHAYSHPDMSKLSLTRMQQEIIRTNIVIQEATGITPTLFAPPSGDFDQRVVEMAARYQMKTILWTADTIDWRKPSPNQWFRTVSPKINNGVLVLMHPTSPTAESLSRLIEHIKAKGLTPGTVSDTISSKRIPAP